jgi:hypothetical protein
VTCGFFEDSLLNLALVLTVIFCCSALLVQPTWSDHELCRFVILTNVLQACASWIGMIVLYILFRSEHFLFAQLGGLTGVLGGLSVALAQQAIHGSSGWRRLSATADAAAREAPSAAMCVAMRHAPSSCVVWAAIVLLTTHAGPPDELLFALNGILAGWVYLRFYQHWPDGTSGDSSPAFELAALFPPPLQFPARVAGVACFGIASSCGVFPPAGWGVDGGGTAAAAPARPMLPHTTCTSQLASSPAPVTTDDPVVAERRRERARMLVDARLSSAKVGAFVRAD